MRARPCGIETYYLGFAADRGSARVAARENATSEKAITRSWPVLKELLSDTKAAESSNLARAVQEHVLHRLRQCRLGTADRGVKRAAPSTCSWEPASPAVLNRNRLCLEPEGGATIERVLLPGRTGRRHNGRRRLLYRFPGQGRSHAEVTRPLMGRQNKIYGRSPLQVG